MTKLGVGTLTLGGANTYTGNTLVSAGTLAVSGGVGVTNSTASFTVSGLAANAASATLFGAGSLNAGSILVGNGGVGTFNLDGGTATTGSVGMGAGSTGTFNFNGGTLRSSASNAAFLQGLTAANVRNGGAKFDTNGKAITVAQALVHLTLSGDSTTDGGLTKLGAGTLTLAGANSYTGGTNISAGTVQFTRTNTMPSSGTVTVGGGAALIVNAGGAGEFTAATSGSGSLGGLFAGIGGQGASVSFASGSAVGIDTTNAAGGNFTFGGAIANPNGGASVLGLNKLGAGTLTLTGTNTYTGGTTISAGTLQLGDGTTSNGSVAGNIVDNAALAFANPNAQTYAGVISGSGGVTKSGAGTLTFSGTSANTHIGDTTVNGGTLLLAKGGQGAANNFGSAMAGNLVANSGGTARYLASSQVPDTRAIIANVGGLVDLNGFAESITLLGVFGGSVTTGTGYVNVRSGGVLADGSSTSSYAGNLHLEAATAGGQGVVSVDTGGTFTISGVVGNGDNGLATQLLKTGNGTLKLQGANTYTGGTSVNAGTLAIPLGSVGAAGPAATFQVDGAAASAPLATLSGTGSVTAGTVRVGGSGAGTFTQSGGTLSTQSFLVGDGAGSTGNFNLSAGTVTVSSGQAIGNAGTGTFTQTGGTFDASTSQFAFAIGFSTGAVGTVNFSAGNFTARGEFLGSQGTGTFNQTGGTNSVGPVTLGSNGGSGTYNLAGGSLLTAGISGGSGTGTFNFNGGTLKPTTSSATFLQGLTAANVRNGAAIIDTNGFNVTVAQPLVHSTIGGDNATDGGFSKRGAGSLILTGVNTYTGGTGVSAGTLAIPSGSINTPASLLLVYGFAADAPTLNISGTGSVTGGSMLVGYTNGAGTVNLSGGSLSSGLTYIGGAGGSGIFNQTGGSATTNGNTMVLGDAVGGTGVYSISGANSTLSAGLIYLGNSGGTGTFNLDGGTLTAANILRPGDSTGTLNLNGGTLRPSASTTAFIQGGPPTNVRNGGAVIDTNSFDIAVAQPLVHSAIGGDNTADGGLTKLGAGTLTLTGASTYTGGTAVTNGTLALGNNDTTTPRLANTSGITVNNGGTLLLAQGGATASANRINDAAAVTLNGGGTLNTGGLSEGTRPSNATALDGAAGLGALTLSGTAGAPSVIDFLAGANGSSLVFSSLTAGSSGAFVDILHWSGAALGDNGAAGNDRMLFASFPAALNLANFVFHSDSDSLVYTGGAVIPYGNQFEIVPEFAPVPEPATWAGALLAAAALGWRWQARKRRRD